eukprot:COSAG01_NODE_61774_length_288_cov_0.238095_1_plen_24_part_01
MVKAVGRVRRGGGGCGVVCGVVGG